MFLEYLLKCNEGAWARNPSLWILVFAHCKETTMSKIDYMIRILTHKI